ncbi:MAG: MFS transporter, partial [Muribaculaceae bacterium]|nr:MFS transporter [Muribaculaceae bacterium]
VFIALAVVFLGGAVYHACVLPRPRADVARRENSASGVMRNFARTVTTFFRRPGVSKAIAFMLLYRLPEALLGKMVQPFLKDTAEAGGLGLTTEQIGIANGTCGVIGIVLGGIIGGICVSRYGLRRMLWPMALALTVPSAFYWYLAAVQPSDMVLICSGLAMEQFGYGFGFTAYMMYMIYFCDGSEYSTSHYAFCTGIMALGLMLPGMVAGELQMAMGYVNFFRLVMVSCLATFAVCAIVKVKQ